MGSGIMRPDSESALSDAIRDATGPLRVVGGGTRVPWRPVSGAAIATGGLNGVRLYEPGALTLVAGAGTPVSDIEAVLSEKGQRLAFEPMDARKVMATTGEPTIGSVFVANVSGPRRVQVGAARDFLLGVRFVDGAGRIVKNGGRVMKNVTGYDLVKLMAGSFGTLGVLSEVSFKVLAVPQAEATLISQGATLDASLAALRSALRSPFDVSGAACFDGRAHVRVEGLSGSVAYRSGALRKVLQGAWDVIEGPESAAMWRDIRDVSAFAGSDDAVWKVVVKPTAAVGLITALEDAGLAHRAVFDWGGGLIWLATPQVGDGGEAEIRRFCDENGGHATLVRAGDALRARVAMFHPQQAALERIAAGLRARFDPDGRLNPGLMGVAAGEPR